MNRRPSPALARRPSYWWLDPDNDSEPQAPPRDISAAPKALLFGSLCFLLARFMAGPVQVACSLACVVVALSVAYGGRE